MRPRQAPIGRSNYPAARTRAIRSTAMWSTSKADGRAVKTRRGTFSVSRMSAMPGSGSTHLGTTSREPFGRYVELGWPNEFGAHEVNSAFTRRDEKEIK